MSLLGGIRPEFLTGVDPARGIGHHGEAKAEEEKFNVFADAFPTANFGANRSLSEKNQTFTPGSPSLPVLT
ncbi:hypothetical protein [Xanthomonas nasturtii]|uniref:hypothetical protein n=1 Tax=Xanthomonas nasturtii TaxID=1843581 RepID=UPI0020119BAB|nr:hypothetical protein [Xanthomonas nasturtii]